jgi:hypothetical protein
MTDPAPDRILDAERIVVETQNSPHRSESSHEALCLDVIFAHSTPAELADGSGLFLALDAFHIFVMA